MKLHIAKGLALPAEAVTQTFGLLGKRGSGKSLTSSAFAAAVASLRKNGLADVAGGEVRASETLFLGGTP